MDELDYKDWEITFNNGVKVVFQDYHMVKQFRTYCFSSRDGLVYKRVPQSSVMKIQAMEEKHVDIQLSGFKQNQ